MTEAESREKAEALLRTRESSFACSCGNGYTPRSITKHVGAEHCPNPHCSAGRRSDGVRLNWYEVTCHDHRSPSVLPSFVPVTTVHRSAHREAVGWPDGRKVWFWVQDL